MSGKSTSSVQSNISSESDSFDLRVIELLDKKGTRDVYIALRKLSMRKADGGNPSEGITTAEIAEYLGKYKQQISSDINTLRDEEVHGEPIVEFTGKGGPNGQTKFYQPSEYVQKNADSQTLETITKRVEEQRYDKVVDVFDAYLGWFMFSLCLLGYGCAGVVVGLPLAQMSVSGGIIGLSIIIYFAITEVHGSLGNFIDTVVTDKDFEDE